MAARAVEVADADVSTVTAATDKVLLVRRGKAPSFGKWSLPGGLVELGETTREAIAREIVEECSIKIRIVDVAGVTEAYRQLHPVVRQLREQQFWIDPFEIKLISPQSPLAQAAAKLGDNHQGITRSGGTQLGGVWVEGAVIYPSALPAKG